MTTTERQLRHLCAAFNAVTRSPAQPYDENNRPNTGCFYLDFANGGVALERMSQGGGCITVLSRGTKASLFERMHAWLDGYKVAKFDAGLDQWAKGNAA